MTEAPIRQAVARVLSSAAGDLTRAGDLRRAHRLAAAARRAGAQDGMAEVVQFLGLLATGHAEAALRAACGHLEASANPDRMIAAFAAGKHVGRRHQDANLRPVVTAVVTDPARRETLLPILEQMTTARTSIAATGLYLLCAISAGHAPKFEMVSSHVSWTAALHWLTGHRPPELLLPLAKQMVARFPGAAFLVELHDFLAAVPPLLPGAWFKDRINADLQIVPALQPGARALLICFGGQVGDVGMPAPYFHRWTQHLAAHVLYLRDPAEDYFAAGIPEIGTGWTDLMAFIRQLASALGVERMATYGMSMGGFPAMRAGIELGAARILNLGGRAVDDYQPGEAGMARLKAVGERWMRTLGDLLNAAPSIPEIRCIYAGDNRMDADQVRPLADLPGVRLVPLPDYQRHNVAVKLAVSGQLLGVLNWSVGASDAFPIG